jgi:hypothetical protein
MCSKQLTMFVILAILLAGTATAPAEVIFNQDFDGGYSGAFGTGQYFSSPPLPVTPMPWYRVSETRTTRGRKP